MQRKEFKEKYNFRYEPKKDRYRAVFFLNGKKYDINRKSELELLKAVERIVNGETATIRTEWGNFIGWSISKKKRSGTIENYQDAYENYISKTDFIDIPLKKITSSDVENLFYKCDGIKSLKKGYWNQIKGTVSRLFLYARDKGIVTSNPTKDIEIPDNCFQQATHIDDELKIFSEFEKEQVKKKAHEYAHSLKDSRYLAIPLLFCIGVRDGELCALKWSDINNGKIHIQREIIDKDKAVYDGTKTPAGNRFIPLNKTALRILSEIKTMNLENGLRIDSDAYILQFKGSFAKTRQIDKRLRRVQKALKFEEIRSPHDVRRTFATELYEHGVSPKKIQRLMGHEKIETTLNSYICDRNNDLDIMDQIG